MRKQLLQLATLLLVLAQVASPGMLAAQDYKSIRDITYGDAPDKRHTLDLFLPENHGPQTPLLIFIHGGSWVSGSKSQLPELLIQELSGRQGYALASINYRLVREGRDRFPAQIEDVSRAITFLKAKALEYGYRASGFALMGGSAGAHLAMLYAYGYDPERQVTAVINLFGPSDLSDKRARPDGSEPDQIITNFLGEPDHRAPIAKIASPVYYLSQKTGVPTLTFHGDADPLVHISQATGLHEILDALKIPAQLEIYPGEGHGFSLANMMDVFGKMTAWLKVYFPVQP